MSLFWIILLSAICGGLVVLVLVGVAMNSMIPDPNVIFRAFRRD